MLDYISFKLLMRASKNELIICKEPCSTVNFTMFLRHWFIHSSFRKMTFARYKAGKQVSVILDLRTCCQISCQHTNVEICFSFLPEFHQFNRESHSCRPIFDTNMQLCCYNRNIRADQGG